MSMVEMMNVGKASAIGWRVIIFYTATTAMAATFGLLAAWGYSPLFKQVDHLHSDGSAVVTLGCNGDGSFLTESPDGSVRCSSSYGSESDIQFEITDVNGHFALSGSDAPQDDMSLSDQIYQGVFMKLLTDNIFVSFMEGNFAAVVFFALVFGAALAREVTLDRANGGFMDATMALLHEMNLIFMRMINWIIMVTPFAVLSLIAFAVGSQQNLATEFANVGFLLLAIMTGMVCQFLVVYVLGLGLLTRSNPFGVPATHRPGADHGLRLRQ